jgi:hypothetical protein
MTVEIGRQHFEGLSAAMLVDIRENELDDGGGRSGLVVHQPDLDPRRRGSRLPRLDEASYQHAIQLHQARLQGNSAAPVDSLIEDFTDPVLGQSEGQWLAAFEPVIVKGRSKEPPDMGYDTGWVVIVKDKKTPRGP